MESVCKNTIISYEVSVTQKKQNLKLSKIMTNSILFNFSVCIICKVKVIRKVWIELCPFRAAILGCASIIPDISNIGN